MSQRGFGFDTGVAFKAATFFLSFKFFEIAKSFRKKIRLRGKAEQRERGGRETAKKGAEKKAQRAVNRKRIRQRRRVKEGPGKQRENNDTHKRIKCIISHFILSISLYTSHKIRSKLQVQKAMRSKAIQRVKFFNSNSTQFAVYTKFH